MPFKVWILKNKKCSIFLHTPAKDSNTSIIIYKNNAKHHNDINFKKLIFKLFW